MAEATSDRRGGRFRGWTCRGGDVVGPGDLHALLDVSAALLLEHQNHGIGHGEYADVAGRLSATRPRQRKTSVRTKPPRARPGRRSGWCRESYRGPACMGTGLRTVAPGSLTRKPPWPHGRSGFGASSHVQDGPEMVRLTHSAYLVLAGHAPQISRTGLSPPAVPDYTIGRPEHRMGVGEFHLTS
jgi:hypothetical protein